MDIYPNIELTSPMPWDMQTQLSSLRRSKRKLDEFLIEDIKTWSERLGHIPTFIVKKTLEWTTQLVDTVEAETRTMPQCYFKVRMPSLRPSWCQEGFHSDMFFSDTRSKRGFECGQVFVGAESSYTYVDMMKGRGYAPSALRNFIWDVPAPAYILTDNAYEEVLGEWEEACKTYCIPQVASEPHHQHQNKAERQIQDVKKRARLLMQVRDVPKKYWDFAVELAVEYLNHIATRKDREPHMIIILEIPQTYPVSIFCSMKRSITWNHMLLSPNQTSLARAGLFYSCSAGL